MLRVLVVDDDQGLRFSVKETLKSSRICGNPVEVVEAVDGLDALEKAKANRFDLVFLDVDMPRLNGLEALKAIKEHDPSVVVIIMTAYATIDDAVFAVKEGAYNYVSKPVKSEDLLHMAERALSASFLISNVAASSPIMMESGRKIIGNTAEMQKVFNIINKLSKVDTPVLIRGASGTGKELVARAIHFNSGRKDARFVAINCSAIPENLFESELFGHEKGSFTGADQRKIGKFQFAEGGTLFLDEIGDMPPLMQVKILRVLQEKQFTPVGANREIESNVRIIAATNRPLEDMIKDGKFREDLFYRLNVIPIFLPALAERKNDVETLVGNFVKKFNGIHSRKVIGIAPNAMQVLKKYDWPGNIREMENVIEHMFVMESGNVLTLQSLPDAVLAAVGVNLNSIVPGSETQESTAVGSSNAEQINARVMLSADVDHDGNDVDMDAADDDDDASSDALDSEDGANTEMVSINGATLNFNLHKEAFEREFIIKALKTFKGRINQTALHANIPKKTLLRKIEKYGINAKDYLEPKN